MPNNMKYCASRLWRSLVKCAHREPLPTSATISPDIREKLHSVRLAECIALHSMRYKDTCVCQERCANISPDILYQVLYPSHQTQIAY